jgi:hypothetical protein
MRRHNVLGQPIFKPQRLFEIEFLAQHQLAQVIRRLVGDFVSSMARVSAAQSGSPVSRAARRGSLRPSRRRSSGRCRAPRRERRRPGSAANCEQVGDLPCSSPGCQAMLVSAAFTSGTRSRGTKCVAKPQ